MLRTETSDLQPTQAVHGPVAAKSYWAGRGLSWLLSLFLLFDGGMKLIAPQGVVEATRQLGYPGAAIPLLGMVLIANTILYLVPRTSILGAILLTAYLGGAVASHVRIGAPLFNVIFAVTFGVLLWGALWLRNTDLRKLLPLQGS